METFSNKVSPRNQTLSAQDAFRLGLGIFILIHSLDPLDDPERGGELLTRMRLGEKSFYLLFLRPHTRPSGTVAAPLPPSDAMFSPVPFCANEDIVVVVNAAAVALVVASVDEVVVLVARRGGRCHAFLFRRRAPASPPLPSPPPSSCAGESAAAKGCHRRCRCRGSHCRAAPSHRLTRLSSSLHAMAGDAMHFSSSSCAVESAAAVATVDRGCHCRRRRNGSH